MSTSSKITTKRSGVMTSEVGTITGDLEVTTDVKDGKTEVLVAYAGAKDVYHVKGQPLEGEVAHEEVLDRLSTEPGDDEYGNPVPISL